MRIVFNISQSFNSTDYLMKAVRTNPQYAYYIAPNKFIFTTNCTTIDR